MIGPKEKLIDKPSTTYYHYTNQLGLLGILKTKKIWASNILFLNDAAELEYAFNLAKDVILVRPKLLSSQKEIDDETDGIREFMSEFNEALESLLLSGLKSFFQVLPDTRAFGNIYVCSFSEAGNLLSQWRGYCENGNGFSLGFDSDSLHKLAQSRNLKFLKCIYDYSEQEEIIRNLFSKSITGSKVEISNVVKVNDSSSVFTDKIKSVVSKTVKIFFENFLDIAPILKHPSFREEQEWRFVEKPERYFDENLKFRESTSFIIPYREIPLSDQSNELPLRRIYIGPSPNKDLSEISVNAYLKTIGIKNCSVKKSEIPFREN